MSTEEEKQIGALADQVVTKVIQRVKVRFWIAFFVIQIAAFFGLWAWLSGKVDEAAKEAAKKEVQGAIAAQLAADTAFILNVAQRVRALPPDAVKSISGKPTTIGKAPQFYEAKAECELGWKVIGGTCQGSPHVVHHPMTHFEGERTFVCNYYISPDAAGRQMTATARCVKVAE